MGLPAGMISSQAHSEGDIGVKPSCSDPLVMSLAARTDVEPIAEHHPAAKRKLATEDSEGRVVLPTTSRCPI